MPYENSGLQKSTWTNCLDISMHSCRVFTSYLQSRTEREEIYNAASFMCFIYISWMENKNVAHPNVIPGDRAREIECLLRWTKRCCTVYVLLLGKKKRKREWLNSVSRTGATALRNKDPPHPPPSFFFWAPFSVLHTSVWAQEARKG